MRRSTTTTTTNAEQGSKAENANGGDVSASENNFGTNNCSKMCSVSSGGVRAKVKQHFCNIGSDSLKVNNNNNNNNLGVQNGSGADGSRYCSMQNGASHLSSSSSLSSSPSQSSSSVQKSAEKERNDVDYYVTHNVDCLNAIEKCPSKVGSHKSFESNLSNGANGHVTNKMWNLRDDESSSGNEADEALSDHECCIYTYKGDQFADLPSSFFTLDLIANGSEQPAEPEEEEEVEEGAAKEVGVDENERSQSGSSPDMDFLEMDFDPGPSLEQDSEEDYDCFDSKGKTGGNSPVPELPNERMVENDLSRNQDADAELSAVTTRLENDLGISSNFMNQASPEPQPGPSSAVLPLDYPEKPPSFGGHNQSICNSNSSVKNNSGSSSNNNNSNNSNSSSSSSSGSITRFCWPARDSWGHHCSSGDLCSPGESSEVGASEGFALWNAENLKIQGDTVSPDTRKYNLHSALYHCIMAKRLVIDKKTLTDGSNECLADMKGEDDAKPSVDTVMVWSEQEACSKQVTQISTSACGATAVINVLIAFNMGFSLDKVKESVATRLRAESAPVPQYLLSRSLAGVTHVDLIRGVHESSNGSLFARFFHMYPRRDFSLSRWLSYWMKKGAVPIATLNLQHGIAPGNPIPDAWHHQMIFGVSSRGIFLTNPLECVREAALLAVLCSPSILKIKRSDILSRWNPGTDLRPLMSHGDRRWRDMNVLGQVVNVVRESTNTSVQGRVITQHISIPASYSSGITLVIPKDSPGYDELASTPELPEYPPQPD